LSQRFREVGTEHLQHRWAGGWRCWLCTQWGKQPLTDSCVRPVEVSLQLVPEVFVAGVRGVVDVGEEGND
jgi:hypothetical protein